MRPERRNGEAIRQLPDHPRTIDTRGSASRLTRCGARQGGATLDSQFQKDELAEATEALELTAMRQFEFFCGVAHGTPLQPVDPASGAKKDRVQKRERTSRNYIAH